MNGWLLSVSCLLSAVMLFAVCCLLFAVYCQLFAVRCLLLAVCLSLINAVLSLDGSEAGPSLTSAHSLSRWADSKQIAEQPHVR